LRILSKVGAVLLAVGLGFLVGRSHAHSAETASSRHVLYWVDPMHPDYKSGHPGIAPDCGMALEPVYADSRPAALGPTRPDIVEDSFGNSAGLVSQTPIATVERTSKVATLRIPGRVLANETRIFNVNAGVDGFVKETHDDAVGNLVRKNQHLATIYSPEFLTVLGGYLSASERTQNSVVKEGLATTQGITGVQNWADRLRNLGVSDTQIAELKETRKIPEDIYVTSPVDGLILSRTVSTNQRFERHTEFYRIADLSQVWITASAPAEDVKDFRPGTVVRVAIPELRSAFQARVSKALPQVDPATQIVNFRLEADNPHLTMRPEMLVYVDLPLYAPKGLTVPREAVMDSGVAKLVFVQIAKDTFQPRRVETGWEIGSRVQIVRGLAEGEHVAAAASFLMDSETAMRKSDFPILDANLSGSAEAQLRTGPGRRKIGEHYVSLANQQQLDSATPKAQP